MCTCKLCHQKRKLIKAHAIPEAFFRELRVNGETPLLISGEAGQFPKRAPVGVYDEEILCEVCEPKFGKIDDYGINVLLKNFDKHFNPMQHNGNLAGFESTTIDSNRLLQFLVTVLWRASVSSQPFYSRVTLGPHEQFARAAVDIPGSSISPVFDAVLSRWRDEGDRIPTTAVLDPRLEKWSGVNAYRLYLGEILAYIKIDSQPFPPFMAPISLRSSSKVFVVARTMSISKDFQAISVTARRSHENRMGLLNAKRSR